MTLSTLSGCGGAAKVDQNSSYAPAAETSNGSYSYEYDGYNPDYGDSGYAAADSTAEAAESEDKSMSGGVYNSIDGIQGAPDYFGNDYLEPYYYEEPQPYYYENPNTEEYNEIEEMGFTAASINPLSTFSADVDTASYSNLRRMIEDGYGLDEIPDGAVRIEELLNYFNYDYAKPKKGDPFGVTTQIADCPWNQYTKIAMIGL